MGSSFSTWVRRMVGRVDVSIAIVAFWLTLPLAGTFTPAVTGHAQDAGSAAPGDAIDSALAAIRGIGTEGAGYAVAIPAAERVRQLPPGDLGRVLDAAADTNPIAENWIRGLSVDIVRRADRPPIELLVGYVNDLDNNPTGRGLAMDLIRRAEPDRATEMLEGLLEDPSLLIREMAVEQAIARAESLAADDRPSDALAAYRRTLTAARHPKQLERIVSALGKLGDDVSTSEAFAMITGWQAIAPFDNENGVGFDQAYPPEVEFAETGRVDLDAEWPGKDGPVRWKSLESQDPEGIVDLAEAYDKEKGAVAYLYAEFESDQTQPAEARLACINANKVWVNGEELMATEVYHAGMMIDQYVAPFEMRPGTNRVLLKICQNEQTESWAQRWQFQFRITDPSGKALRVAE